MAFTVMVFTIVAAVAFRGFWSRIAIFLALIFGFVLSWVLDKVVGEITAPTGAGEVTTHFRVDLGGVSDAGWFGLPAVCTRRSSSSTSSCWRCRASSP